MMRIFCVLGLLGCVAVSTPAWAQGTDEGAFTLNLKNADITTLIATVSEVTGRNFIIDPRVKGNVTVLSATPMTANELYQTFLSVLEVHGFAAVPAGQVTKIIPQINAKQAGAFGTDPDTEEEIVTRVVQLDNVPADQLVPILRPLIPQYGHLAAYVPANSLIISDRAANVERVNQIIKRIDNNGMTHVQTVELQHASASDVVAVLKRLRGPQARGMARVAADTRTNSIIISGNAEQRARARSIIAELDTRTQRSGGTQVIYLDYADAEELAPVLQDYAASAVAAENNGTTATASGEGTSSVVSVIAEPSANALVVTAPADIMTQIRTVIEKLDIRRGQILLEGIIAEISLSRSRKLGVNIGAYNENGFVAGSILDSQTLKAIPSLALDGTPLELIQQGLNLALGTTNDGGTNFALLINALSGNTNTNVLSTPSLITLDNEEAEITVGQEVPFVTGSYATGVADSPDSLVNPFQTIERKDVGLTLKFTPQINAGDTVQLEIDLEISDIARNTGITGAVDLITNTRELSTTVAVDDGQILVLGGLISNNISQTVQKVPLLGDIPLLGALFTYRDVSKDRRNLLIFIRPTILRGGDIASSYTRRRYNYIRSLQRDQAGDTSSFLEADKLPELPPIEEFGAGDLTPTSRSFQPQGIR